MTLVSFFCLIFPASTFRQILRRSEDSEKSCPVLDFKEFFPSVFSFQMMLHVALSYVAPIILMFNPSKFIESRAFSIKIYYILSKYFCTSIGMIMWLHLNVIHKPSETI